MTTAGGPGAERANTLYLGGVVLDLGHRPAEQPAHTAMLVGSSTVLWTGTDADAARHADTARRVVHLDGALVTPAFVDAHVHLSATGAALRGVDLGVARSLHEALHLVEAATRRLGGRPLLAHGWDETQWPERRPFTAHELDRAAYGGVVYAPRVDGHCAVVSSALAAATGLREEPGRMPDGLVRTDAHHHARDAFDATVTPAQRREDIRAALQAAAAAGVGCVHEMGGPVVSSTEDLAAVREVWAPGLPRVVGYWAELVSSTEQVFAVKRTHGGVAGLAGDLNVDGSIGARTARLRDAYADRPEHRGEAFLTVEQVRDHVVACTAASTQAGFHVIGDAGIDTAVAGFEAAADAVGLEQMRGTRHRLEHVEMVAPEGAARLARLGVVASVQPAFDARWGGPSGMYAQRLGAERARGMNPFRTLLDAGVALAFGSDSPVTPVAPWEAIRAAVHHHDEGQRITAGEAFHAHTVGGDQAATGVAGAPWGVGAPAQLALWDGWEGWVDDRDGTLLPPPREGPAPVAREVVSLGTVLYSTERTASP